MNNVKITDKAYGYYYSYYSYGYEEKGRKPRRSDMQGSRCT